MTMNLVAAATPALLLQGVVKRFGKLTAVDRLDLVIPQGEFHVLLGPNGAGKTTTIRMICGLTPIDDGEIQVLGASVGVDGLAAKRQLAYLPDEPLLYDKLTCMEYLEFVSGLWGVDPQRGFARATELLTQLDLAEKAHQACEGLSRGMRQKLALAGALLHDPGLLILDEPLTGLDAASARVVKDILIQRVATGRTVLLTTHIMEMAERLLEETKGRVSMIRAGRIVHSGTLAQLRAEGEPHATLESLFLARIGAPVSHANLGDALES
jgi:ABC-2 type transport system ATP-binding protein